ncbi:hypothetical protein [Larkinella soli]|uniref:hypothetical protein n=1 Tax=Larkinella soli TaxID=1770527 RepID=UPI000FFC192B|nr:hypothetical protein [Larkinella soli]
MNPAQDPFAAYQPAAEPETSSEEKNRTHRKVAVMVGGTTLAGASLAGLAWGMSRSNPEETSVLPAVEEGDLRIDKEGAIRVVEDRIDAPSDIPAVDLPADDVLAAPETAPESTFAQAFRAARDEMGAGKFFTWQGSLYSTNYKEEWEEKPATEQNAYFADLGLSRTEPAGAPDGPLPVQDDVPPETAHTEPAPPAGDAEVEDGIPVSIDDLNNAEYSSDKITIVDAVTIDEDRAEAPVAVTLGDDGQEGNDDWALKGPGDAEEDSGLTAFQMPQYDSSMTDDWADDDGDDATAE